MTQKTAQTNPFAVQIPSPTPGAGRRAQDSTGDVYRDHQGRQVAGRIGCTEQPYLLQARQLLHAGFVPPECDPHARVLLIAFTSINVNTQSGQVLHGRLNQGFRISQKINLQEALFEQPRLKQLTIQELLKLSPAISLGY